MYREAAATSRDLLITAFASKVFALERASGAVRWQQVIEQERHLLDLPLAAKVVDLHVGATVVLAVTSTSLVFIEYASGTIIREVKKVGAYEVRPQVLIDGEHLFVAGSGEVVCYTLSGDHVWTQPFRGEGYGNIAFGFPNNVRQADDRGTR